MDYKTATTTMLPPLNEEVSLPSMHLKLDFFFLSFFLSTPTVNIICSHGVSLSEYIYIEKRFFTGLCYRKDKSTFQMGCCCGRKAEFAK